MIRLNAAQHKAVTTTKGRVLILAGAGSGKTKVLTTRIGYLVNECHVPPESILGLTFTNKAAEEMRCRLGAFIGANIAKKVMLSTFHSFCMWLLRREAAVLGYTNDFTLYDRQDVNRLVTGIARDILEHEGAMPSLTKTIETIGLAKNRGLSPKEIVGTGSKWHDQFSQEVGQRLHDSLRAYNAVDFDHLLWLAVELLEQHPEVLARYQGRFQYVMIDEYQDTNPIQAKIAQLLTARSGNLCVVGDDDQSIYSWRGADVLNILRFENAEIITLDQNFRSTNTILRAANSVIEQNTKRHKKVLWSDKGEGASIEVFYAPTEAHEAEAVVNRLIQMKEEKKLNWGDCAILYRSNALARPIESALLRRPILTADNRYQRIPYQVYGGDEFYEHKEVKDLLAYLRVILNSNDHEALLRIINYPRRGIGEATLDILTQEHRSSGIALWQLLKERKKSLLIPERGQVGIEKFVKLIEWAKERFLSADLATAMQELIVKLHFHKAIFEEVKSDAMRKWKLQNIDELVNSIKEYQERSEKPLLVEFLSTMVLGDESFRGKKNMEEDHLHLMTFHSAKGLEFRACFLIGLEDHLIPHEKSIQAGDVEEERRLLYVALTRAKEFLTLSMASSRKRMGSDTPSKPSRFLFEIPKELLRATRWDSVVG